jgi:hypothetical protein
LPEPSEVLLEACWNWGTVHDTLEESAAVAAVLVSHPAKNRIIADAQIKTDKVDAQALGTLLRGRFFAQVHVPSRGVRAQKNVLRRRLWLARLRTMIRSRIHALLDRHPAVPRPQFKDPVLQEGAGVDEARVDSPKGVDSGASMQALAGNRFCDGGERRG